MRDFCWTCHRPIAACFCAQIRPFETDADFALIVHPYEVKSTVGTAWILRRSISNLKWVRSNGIDLDTDLGFLEILKTPDRIPLLLFPGQNVFNLNQRSNEAWNSLISDSQRPLFFIVDGTWSHARAILRRSKLLRNLPRVSFDTLQDSEYEFKKQPNEKCLSSVEGIHRVIEVLASRGWSRLPALREHDQMIEIFRNMVKFQLMKESISRTDSHRQEKQIVTR